MTPPDLGMPGLINGLFVRLTSSSSEDAVKAQLYAPLPVWAVASTAGAIQDTNDMLRLYYGFIGVIMAFGMALAGAIVFNAVTINILERGREIATMRTIGMRGQGRSVEGLGRDTTQPLATLKNSRGTFSKDKSAPGGIRTRV